MCGKMCFVCRRTPSAKSSAFEIRLLPAIYTIFLSEEYFSVRVLHYCIYALGSSGQDNFFDNRPLFIYIRICV